MRKLLFLLLFFLMVSLFQTSIVKAENNLLSIEEKGTEFKIAYIANNSKVDHRVYQLSNKILEWEIILKELPITNIFQYQFTSKDLTFYYQPPLTEELDIREYDLVNATHAIKDNITRIYRPLNITRSYAVYHSYKRHNEYTTGKIFHIYRPFLIDAKNETCWADLNITGNTLTVTCDLKFLASASYPVIIDPSFGKDDVGGTEWVTASSHQYVYSCTADLNEDGTVTSMSFYGNSWSGTDSARTAIYDDNSNPDNLEVQSTIRTDFDETTQWWDFTTSTSLTTATYWLALKTSDWSDLYYDSAGANSLKYVSNSWGTGEFPDPFGTPGGGMNRLLSLFANYTTVTGVDNTYTLFENVLIYGSTLLGVELGYRLPETIRFFSSGDRGIERGFILGDVIYLLDSVSTLYDVGREFTFILFETVRILASPSVAYEVVAVAVELTLNDVLGLAAIAFLIGIIALVLILAKMGGDLKDK